MHEQDGSRLANQKTYRQPSLHHLDGHLLSWSNLNRYALETNDVTGLAELVRRADAGEPIIDDSHLLESNEEISVEEKLERFAEMICQAGDQPEMKTAALLVLMSTLENSEQPRVLANFVKHIAFTRCAELNCYGMVDAQVAAIESELLVN